MVPGPPGYLRVGEENFCVAGLHNRSWQLWKCANFFLAVEGTLVNYRTLAEATLATSPPRVHNRRMTTRGNNALSMSTSHVRVDEAGVAWIDDTQVKVVEIILEKFAHGWSPEETHFQHPDLSLAQIYSALAWYYEHQAVVDMEIERRLKDVELRMSRAVESPLRKRLRAMGRIA
jgi:uncharacterized protein (DUF433 family)